MMENHDRQSYEACVKVDSLTRGFNLPLCFSRTSLAEWYTLISGGCGRGETTTSGTLSSWKCGCQRVSLSSGTMTGGFREARNVCGK